MFVHGSVETDPEQVGFSADPFNVCGEGKRSFAQPGLDEFFEPGFADGRFSLIEGSDEVCIEVKPADREALRATSSRDTAQMPESQHRDSHRAGARFIFVPGPIGFPATTVKCG